MVELSAADWLTVVRREYLDNYIPSGGSAVKFVVPHPPLRHEDLRGRLAEVAEHGDFQFAFVDSADTRIHLIDRLFHAIARQLDWEGLAYFYLTRLLSEQGYRLPDERHAFGMSAIADLNERAEPLLRQEIRSGVEKAVLADHGMSQEFQLAAIGLCKSLLDPGYDPIASAIKDWLLGDPVRISSLKPALIFQRVGRDNARHMLTSLTYWLRVAGKSGLVLVLDITRYAQTVRTAQRDGTSSFYSAAAALDAYEVLRQFVDGIDELTSCFVTVMAGQEFLSDERRGYRAYHALNLRIADEVHDRSRDNPRASLVRLHAVPADNPRTAPTNGRIQDRRAIEALRAGVPNRDAVTVLGCAQPAIEASFQELLNKASDGVTAETQPPGIVVAGEFGSGKSHLLEYLMHVALEQRFVCSKVVISKETPLHDPAKLYRSAIHAAVVQGRKGAALTEVASSLDFSSDAYATFRQWVNQPRVRLNSRFPATVFLYERESGKDPEVRDRIVSFWSGDPLGVAPLRMWLKAHGEAGSYQLEKVPTRDLWLQRFRFAARLMVAAGFRGWLLLVDEVELVGRYSFKQRARSYAELARWAGRLQGEACPGLATVFAVTSDFSESVLYGRNDLEVVPGKLQATGNDADMLLARQAERGMRLLDDRRRPYQFIRLQAPATATIDETRDRIQEIYRSAYGWSAPSSSGGERLTSTSMRQFVRRWINEWDLKGLYPGHDVDMVVEDFKPDYSEDRDLEVPPEDESGQPPQ